MKGERLTVWVAFAANLAIAVLKGFAGIFTGSSATLAEAAHSVADTTNQGFLLVSLSLGRREPDEAHPFGYGRERFLWAFVASMFMFLAGAIFSFARGFYGLVAGPVHLGILGGGGSGERFWLLYAILGFALAAESTSLARAVRRTLPQAREQGLGLLAFVRQSKEPTTKTVVYEDSVAVAGVLIAFAGVGLHHWTGSDRAEAAAAVLIGALLMGVAVGLFRDTKGLLIGEAARPEERERVRSIITAEDAVADVLDLRTMYLGPKTMLVAARVDLENGVGADEIERIADRIDGRLRDELPDVKQVFLDPTPGKSG